MVYKGNAVDKNPPALSYLAFNLMDVTGLEEEDLTNLQDLAPNESCQVSLHEHPDLLPPGTVLSPFDRLHPDLDLCNEEQILQLTLVYLKLGWIETKYATFPAKNIVGRIAGAVLPKSKRRFWETLGNIGSFGGGCLLGANDRSAPLTDFGLIGTGNKSDDLAAGGFLITAISVSALAGDAFNVLN